MDVNYLQHHSIWCGCHLSNYPALVYLATITASVWILDVRKHNDHGSDGSDSVELSIVDFEAGWRR